MVTEEHQAPARPQEPMRLGNPQVRVAPDRCAVLADREVERGVGLRHRFGVAVHPLDVVDAVFDSEPAGGGELFGRVVDGVHPRASSLHPRRHVAGPAPEFDRSLTGEVIGQQREFLVRDAPDPPRRLGLGPRPLTGGNPPRRSGVPVSSVLGDVVSERGCCGIGHGASVHDRARQPPHVSRSDVAQPFGVIPISSTIAMSSSTDSNGWPSTSISQPPQPAG